MIGKQNYNYRLNHEGEIINSFFKVVHDPQLHPLDDNFREVDKIHLQNMKDLY